MDVLLVEVEVEVFFGGYGWAGGVGEELGVGFCDGDEVFCVDGWLWYGEVEVRFRGFSRSLIFVERLMGLDVHRISREQ